MIGPSKAGAQLEGSKDFAKAFMMRHNIPTARYKSITAENIAEGYAFLESLPAPYVLKADGLAAGKGVLILETLEEAKKELGDMLNGMFGDASKTVVIEEFLTGIECSVFVMTDGTNYKVLPVAKDYKRIGEGNTGLNTGGMGAAVSYTHLGLCLADTSCTSCAEEQILSQAKKLSEAFISTLPEMRCLLATDAEAAYNGDPAAQNINEVIFCYPGFRAIGNYRIAHQLYKLGVPFIPRMITEMAHSETGIDIHPVSYTHLIQHCIQDITLEIVVDKRCTVLRLSLIHILRTRDSPRDCKLN